MSAINRVPPEFWREILVLAQSGQSAREQQQTRLTLARVCWTWYKCADRWRVVAIQELYQAEELLEFLEAGDRRSKACKPPKRLRRLRKIEPIAAIAAKVRTIVLDVKEAHPSRRIQHDKLAQLLGRFTEIETPEIALEGVDFDLQAYGLGENAYAALASYKKVKHFTISSPAEPTANITDGIIAR